MADTRDPLRQLFDVAVYAPIGLMLLARQELPNLAAAGRHRVDSQLTLARFVGKLAVNRGRQTLQDRLGGVAAHRAQPAMISSEPLTAHPVVDAVALDVTPSRALEQVPEPIVPPPIATPPVSTPPVEHAPAPIAAPPNEPSPHVSESDRTPDADVTALPIEGYDSLAASQVVGRLPTLNATELDAILRHEQAHRARRTILGKISQLQAR